jgi:propanediol utilization protein
MSRSFECAAIWFALDTHVDTDEANAAGLTNDSVASFDG